MGDLKIEWTTVSKQGAHIEVRTAPIPKPIQEAIERALQLGKAATNTTSPPIKSPSVK
jgi:hypothetical protein